MGVVPPARGFNRALSAIAHEHGALLILDEVLTGFRVGRAGWWGLEASRVVPDGAGWQPDLFTFGKVIGGGMPLAALGGRADIMDLLAPLGPVYQAGTLSGNPVAVAAGIATLRAADAAVYAHARTPSPISSRRGVSAALAAEGVEHTVQRAGNLFSFAFASGAAAQLRGCQGAGGVPLPAVLPRDARRRGVPAAVGVRGLVRLGRPRRRGGLPHPRGRPRRGEGRRCRAPLTSGTRTDSARGSDC